MCITSNKSILKINGQQYPEHHYTTNINHFLEFLPLYNQRCNTYRTALSPIYQGNTGTQKIS